MAKPSKDISTFLGNNKKAMHNAAVIEITPALFKQTEVATGDCVTISKLPANSLLTAAYLVVQEACTGASLSVKVGKSTLACDLSSKCATKIDTLDVQALTKTTDVDATVTLGSDDIGKAYLVIEFTELEGYLGTFLG